MKKFLTLVLALVLALALTVPAMAFTSVQPEDDEVPELDIYLVEFEDDEFFGFAGAAPSDRGYAKNEIVAAIVELTVPDGYGVLDSSDFKSLVFSGDNVNLNVTDNTSNFRNSTNVTLDVVKVLNPGVVAGDITLAIQDADADATVEGFADDATYKWMFFAKVTGDEASLTATLDADDPDWVGGKLVVGDYVVTDGTNEYLIEDDANNSLVRITTDKDNKTKDLYIFDEAEVEYLAVNPEAGVFYTLGGVRVATSSSIRDLQAVYEDVFVEEFGFDFSISGGILKPDYFEDLNGTDDIEATVEIKPWTAYVTVPDNIVVDPPKTGDAASIVGFVMIVLAAAAVVAVKKVRA